MQFTTLTLSALSAAGALAASTGQLVHVVKVGNANGSLVFAPNQLTANVGEMVQFQFAPNNHTVTQSTFAAPCEPMPAVNGTGPIFSGFMPVSATDTTVPTYTVMINATTPIWLYCSQGEHCQKGMSMVINVAAGSNKTLAAYQAAAKSVTASGAPSVIEGGAIGTNSTSGSSGTGTSGTGSSASGSATGSAASSTTTKGSAAVRTTAERFSLLAGVVAVGLALVL
ncbi:hypothetical protein G7Y89_g13726 [Cudoniella acicularis]|uniref:Phytocyanin domain-containing protein n=1 Tax=Cudoniella acicularis TaxID=354080 RepID=A0A8H4VW56_9HELO|nr:hypothetical protein G7Y89_g13726 [Cudoniella acicularis]